MPYIVTHGQRHTASGRFDKLSESRAVATLFEAREEAAYRIEQITGGDPDYEEMYTDAQNCSELGETFGPLPDGSAVEVKRIQWHELRDLTDLLSDGEAETYGDAIIEAFNAR